MNTKISPFLTPGLCARADSLANLHLRRDLQIPVVLRSEDDQDEGYDEGKVTNTRFGSFPHSTLIDVPWGSQVRASTVDTGSRGRRCRSGKSAQGQKRKRDLDTPEGSTPQADDKEGGVNVKAAVVAPTGFVHILPPTPESWTLSLPHRTQVVYTPDYSYILQRLRARPGSTIIEAGAGSGSFTHAAARAVFNGYCGEVSTINVEGRFPGLFGKVWSFEFHAQRVEALKGEIKEHGLDSIVGITHRDVCADGFSVFDGPNQLVHADAIFLDLPAPWLALEHLTRESEFELEFALETSEPPQMPAGQDTDSGLPINDSVLDDSTAVRICTFSPCIEQVQRTVSTLHRLGWLDIEMVELAARRLEVRRERVGLQEEGLRGVNASCASVDEAVNRLREMEQRTKKFHDEYLEDEVNTAAEKDESAKKAGFISKQKRLAEIRDAQVDRKLYKEGRLLHRVEPEIKTHTSYLVFAILPRRWSEEDEAKAQRQWASKTSIPHANKHIGRRQMKRNAKSMAGGNKAFEMATNAGIKPEADGPQIKIEEVLPL